MTEMKRRLDALKGKSYRERAVDFLNDILQGEARVRLRDDGTSGFDCVLSANWSNKSVTLIIRKKTDPDLYYKMIKKIHKDKDSLISYLEKAYFLLLNNEDDPVRSTEYSLVPGNLFKWWQSQSEGNENRLSAITNTGKLINPQLNLPWISISDGRKGFLGDEPDLKTALLNLLKEQEA